MNIQEILKKHAAWLAVSEAGERANLSGANLSGANLSDATLRRADLSGATLIDADLSGANLRRADLIDANLSGANLSGANLIDADLSGANLIDADLSGANLSGANLIDANLGGANLSGANLSDATLSDANLSGANLSDATLRRAKGLLSAASWLAENFEKTVDGYVVLKRIGGVATDFAPRPEWVIEAGAILQEVPNQDRGTDCGCGVNFGTKAYVEANNTSAWLWKCLLRWEDLPDVCVPYNTDGKARCGHLQLIERII